MTEDEGGEEDEGEEKGEEEEATQGSEAGRLIACDKLLGDMMGTGDYVRR